VCAAVSEKAKVKETVGLYSKVFRLPTFRGIILRLASLILIVSIAAAAAKAVKFSPSVFLGTFLYFAALLTFAALLGLWMKRKGHPLDLRRTTGVILSGSVFWFTVGLIGTILESVFGIAGAEGRAWLFGAMLAYLLFAFLVSALSDRHPLLNHLDAACPVVFFLLVVWLLEASYPSFIVLPQMWLIIIAFSIIASSAAVQYIFRAVGVPFARDLGISGPELLRAFARDYLSNDPKPFEAVMTRIATLQDLPISVVVLRHDSKLVGVAVIPYVHPGPFRDIGGSDLPAMIVEHIRSKHGVPALVMHGTCTHHQNLTTKDDIQEVLGEVDRLIEQTPCTDRVVGPLRGESGKFKVVGLGIGDAMLGIVTSAPEFTDDIGLEVGLDAARRVTERSPSIRRVAVVDAHNSIDDDAVSIMPGDPEAKVYEDSLVSTAALLSNQQSNHFEVGMHQFQPSDISRKDGLGDGGLCTLALRVQGKLHIVLSIDGNNMEPGFREDIITLLRSLGASDAEVITTDTHVVNAVALSSRGYPPVGRYQQGEFLKAAEQSARSAIESLQPAAAGLGLGQAKNMRTFGEKGFDTLTGDIAESASIAGKVGPVAGTLAALLSLLFTLLL